MILDINYLWVQGFDTINMDRKIKKIISNI